MTIIIFILSIALSGACGGVLYRCEGGFIGTGSTMAARLMWWCIPTALLVTTLYDAQYHSWNYWLALSVAGACYVGRLIPHSWCQNKSIGDYAGMGVVGGARLGLIAIAALPFFNLLIPFTASGLLWMAAAAVGYEAIGSRELIVWHPKNPNAAEGFDRFATTGGEWEEVCIGFISWAGITAIMLRSLLWSGF